MVEQSKQPKKFREIVREQQELDDDLTEGNRVIIPRQRHLKNVEASDMLLERLKLYHGETYHGD